MQAQTSTRAMRRGQTDRTRTAEAKAETLRRRQVRAWKAGRS